MSLPVLETERLTVREMTMNDLEAHHRLIVEAFESDQSIEDTRLWLEWTVRNYRELEKLHQPPYGDFAIDLKETGAYVGSIGLVQSAVPWGVFDETTPEERRFQLTPEFGLYWGILPEHWGKGYAAEAARRFIDHHFGHLNPRRMVATTEHDNVKSQRVMEKLGMTVMKNPLEEPFWFNVVGVLENTSE